MSSSTSALQVAAYAVEYGVQTNHLVTSVYLQKILYLCQKQYLYSSGMPLFDDDFQAWRWGPVIPEVHSQYSIYTSTGIERAPYCCNPLENDQKLLVQVVMDFVNGLKPWQLSNIVNGLDSIWYKVYSEQGEGSVIPKFLIPLS